MSTEFLLEIEQRMKGANPVSELQATEQALKSAMAGYAQFEKQVSSSAKGLERVGSSITATRSKMQKAMEAGDTKKFWELSTVLDKLEGKQRELKTASTEAAAAMKKQQGTVGALADKFEELTAAETKAAEASKGLDVEGTAGGIKKLGGPLGGAGDMVEEYSEAWGKLKGALGPAGAALAVAGVAVVALTALVVAGAYAVAKFALSSANAARDSKLLTQALQIQVGAGDELGAAMKKVGKDTGVAADRQREIIRSLKDAGVAAKDMPDALRAIATQEAALGNTDGTQSLIDSMKDGKKSASQLAAEMDSKFGGIVKQRMMGLDQQSERLSTNIAGIFDGLNIEPVLEAFAMFVDLFDEGSESGKLLREVARDMLQPIIDGAPGAMTAFIKDLVAAIRWCQQLRSDLQKVDKALQFDLGALGKIDGTAVAANSSMTVLTGGLWGLGDAADALTLDAIAADFRKIGGWGGEALDSLRAKFPGVASAIDGLVDSVTSFGEKAIDLGKSIVDGIIAGVKAGAQAVADAVGAVAQGAIDAAKEVLDTGSPSKVFRQIGGWVTDGFAQGVDDSAPAAESAMVAMVEPPNPKQGKAPAGGGGGATFSFAGAIFNFHGGDGKQQAEDFFAQLTQLLEGAGLQEAAA